MSEENNHALVDAEQEQRIERTVLAWLNACPDKPVPRIHFEFLPAEGVALALSTLRASTKMRQYIDGSYDVEHQFRLIYRVMPDGNDSRLSATEALNRISAWAERNADALMLGDGIIVRSFRRESSANLLNVWQDGSQDYEIQLNLNYGVRK